MNDKRGIGFFERYLSVWVAPMYYCRNCGRTIAADYT